MTGQAQPCSPARVRRTSVCRKANLAAGRIHSARGSAVKMGSPPRESAVGRQGVSRTLAINLNEMEKELHDK